MRNAGLNVNYAYERLDLTQKLFDNASQAFDLAEARYKLGSSSIVELSQSQLDKTTAQIANTSAKYEYEIQRAMLNFEIGDKDNPTLIVRNAGHSMDDDCVHRPTDNSPTQAIFVAREAFSQHCGRLPSQAP